MANNYPILSKEELIAIIRKCIFETMTDTYVSPRQCYKGIYDAFNCYFKTDDRLKRITEKTRYNLCLNLRAEGTIASFTYVKPLINYLNIVFPSNKFSHTGDCYSTVYRISGCLIDFLNTNEICCANNEVKKCFKKHKTEINKIMEGPFFDLVAKEFNLPANFGASLDYSIGPNGIKELKSGKANRFAYSQLGINAMNNNTELFILQAACFLKGLATYQANALYVCKGELVIKKLSLDPWELLDDVYFYIEEFDANHPSSLKISRPQAGSSNDGSGYYKLNYHFNKRYPETICNTTAGGLDLFINKKTKDIKTYYSVCPRCGQRNEFQPKVGNNMLTCKSCYLRYNHKVSTIK